MSIGNASHGRLVVSKLVLARQAPIKRSARTAIATTTVAREGRVVGMFGRSSNLPYQLQCLVVAIPQQCGTAWQADRCTMKLDKPKQRQES